MRGKREAGATSRIALLLAGAVLGAWLLCMLLLTAATAEAAAQRFLDKYQARAGYIARMYESYTTDGDELDAWYILSSTAQPSMQYRQAELLKRGSGLGAHVSAAVYGRDGDMTATGTRDFFVAETYTEDQWESQDTDGRVNRLVFFDRSCLTAEPEALNNARALKLTGALVDGEFVPASISGISLSDFMRVRNGFESVPEVMQRAALEWSELYRDPDAAESLTLYAELASVNCPEPSGAIKFTRSAEYDDWVLNGSYEDLGELLLALGGEIGRSPGLDWSWRYSGTSMVVASAAFSYTYEGESIVQDGLPYGWNDIDADYYVICVASFSPWLSAAHELIWHYAASLAIALLLALIVLLRVRRQLIAPVTAVGDALLSGARPEVRTTYIWRWHEAVRLREGLYRRSDELVKLENERTRLSRALDYSRAAEENRRRTVSAVAHELKTPLAVIHSYAEGLREHIAEDKREKYIDVILAEAERSDAMVLEMMDFSRLEAGKIKLARDEFSLAALVRSEFEKLEVPASAKRLRLSFDFPEDFTVIADEQRIAQVIENLASNAVKYTPEGGSVSVKLADEGASCTLTVANDGPRLTDEQLDNVWEPFYRVDESRTEPGTGLGLAISRSIISLHGGKCFAANTPAGVRFGFTLTK